jgi:hypothetical protein
MPLTVTASNGQSYHLWQLPLASSPELETSVTYETIDNPLTDGHKAGILCGPTAGTKSWKLTFPTLTSGDVFPGGKVYDINGAFVSREEYVRSLYAVNKVSGRPFVFRDPEDLVYYFVDFADENLSMKQFLRMKMYVSGITLVQRRLPGVTISA